MAERLPPGQRASELRRFGLPQYAGVRPQPSSYPVLTVTGGAHPRGRVAREERNRYLPGRVWRPVWRAGQPLVRRAYDRRAGT
jgi:hypothetical protein